MEIRRFPHLILCVLFFCVACDQVVAPPADVRQNSPCSPWQQAGQSQIWIEFYRANEALPDRAYGCLLVTRGEQSTKMPAAITRNGQLEAWDGKNFTPDAQLRLMPPQGEEKLQFWFYFAMRGTTSHDQLEGFCERLTPDSYRTCVKTGDSRSCLAVMAFRPSVPGIAAGDILLPEKVADIDVSTVKGGHCRLFFGSEDPSEITFPTFSNEGCKCESWKDAVPAAPLELKGKAKTMALSDDGLLLFVAASQTLHVFKRSATDQPFGTAQHTFPMNQAIWKLQISPKQTLLAVLMDTSIEVFRLNRLGVGVRESLLKLDAPAGKVAANIAFRPNNATRDMLAVSYYGPSDDDRIELWFVGLGAVAKKVWETEMRGPQSLTFDRSGGFFIIGVSGTVRPPYSSFRVFQIKGDESEALLINTGRGFITDSARPNLNHISVTPDNKYLLIGTGPDLLSLRKLVQNVETQGEGQIMVWPTTPMATRPQTYLTLPGEAKAHKLYTQTLHLSKGGNWLASLGMEDTGGKQMIHMWRRQERLPYFAYVTSLSPPQGTLDLLFGWDCRQLFASASQSTTQPVWQACQ